MIQGQSRGDASVASLTAAATSEISPMMRSAIGLRSWSCGGLVVWCTFSLAQNSRKYLDMSFPSRSEWMVRTRGRAMARPCSSTGVYTVALKAAMMRATASAASDLSLMNSMKM